MKLKPERLKKAYREGWNSKGEWNCPLCGVGYGKNLKDEKPFALVAQHVREEHGDQGE